MSGSTPEEALRSDHVLEYPYMRSVGPVLGTFFGGLKEGRLLAVRSGTDKVVMPPTEYDPETGEATGEFVEVGPEGTVETWSWVEHPSAAHPLDHPFGWALVKLDGATTSVLHVLDVEGGPEAITKGMRVRAEFVAEGERVGRIQDIRAFVPAAGNVGGAVPHSPGGPIELPEPIETLATPMRLDYEFSAGVAQSKTLRGLAEGKFIGQRCPVCRKVYVPSRGSCPVDGKPTTEIVTLPDTGTVTTFCVVNVPFAGQSVEIPYTCAQVLLDGADISFMALIQEIPTAEVRMGLRVEAVWAEELGPTMASVKYFRPTGEADADYESYKDYT